MVSKTIKISEENYKWLVRIAAEIQKKKEKPVSFDEVIYDLRGGDGKDLMSFAGSWEMSDREAEDFLKNAKKGWKKWKIPSV